MKTNETLASEESLDPHDWQAFRNLAHRMLDEMTDYLQTVANRPVWQEPPKSAKEKFNTPLPIEPEPQESIYAQFVDYILPYPLGNIHPRFWGWVSGTGTPFGMLAEMLAAGMNSSCHTGEHIANYVEAQVLNWCKEILGYPQNASGLVVSGGSTANLLCLTVARNSKAGFDIRCKGVQASQKKMILYCSSETHFSVQKSIEVLGLGNENIRKVAVNDNFQIDISELEKAIQDDKVAGHHPFCVVANFGTVNTGAIDDLDAIANLCTQEDLWFHIDGAFGALTVLLPEFEQQRKSLEKADSVAFDFHKWMSIPYEAGCVLIKDAGLHRKALELVAAYTVTHEKGIASGPYPFTHLGIEQSRGFKSLKIWFSIKEHGIKKYQQLIQQNIAQAEYLAALIESEPSLELLAPVPLNIVCFRFVCKEIEAERLNGFNKEILMQLHEQGIAAPSFTFIQSKYAIRVAITNHRSRKQDFEVLVDEVIRIGNELLGTFIETR